MVLTRSEAETFYDRFGEKQDDQAFYEDAALDDLVAHAAFERAEKIFEFGCGTGRFADRLLTEYLSPSASYFGIDISQTMIDIATERLSSYANRTKVARSDGSIRLPVRDHSLDHVVSTYVLDLLPETDIHQFISEAHRVLKPNGKLCLVGLTKGVTPVSRIVSGLWSVVFHLRAGLVGGCRPIRLEPYFDEHDWKIDYRNVVTKFGIPSEVIIVIAETISDNAPDTEPQYPSD